MTASPQVIEVLSPQADIDARKIRPAKRIPTFDGKKIGLASNRKPGANWVLDRIAQLLSERYRDVKFERFDYAARPFTAANMEQMVKSGCDAFVGSNGD